MNRQNTVKIISLIIIMCILFATITGCKENTPTTQLGTSSATDTSSADNSSEDTSSDEVQSEDTSSEEDISNNLEDDDDLDLNLDLDFSIDLTISQTVTFDKKVQDNFAGLCGVFPCYWFLPDSTMDEPYSEKDLEISIKKLMQMGMSKVRCLNFEPAYAWDSVNDKWDWDSECMKGFYKYCDLMKENGIEIILNTAEGHTNGTSKISTENPIPIVSAREQITPQQAYGAWVVEFVKEVVIKRGYDNIKYWEEATEPNNSSTSREKFDTWAGWMKAGVDALRTAGFGSVFKHIGPSAAFRPDLDGNEKNIQWIIWATQELNDYIDIYACHTYVWTDTCTDDYYSYWEEFTESARKYIEPTGKLFWCDEYNVARSGGTLEDKTAVKKDPLHASQVALAQISLMLNNVNCSMLWYPVEIKFPNTLITEGEFFEGIHKAGLDRSVIDSLIPYNGYYTYTLLGSVIQEGDTVYAGSDDMNGLHTILLKHKNGKYSIIAINMSWTPIEATFELPNIGKSIFTKAYYDPSTFKASAKATPIAPSSEISASSNQFVDTVNAYNVVVYNQK